MIRGLEPLCWEDRLGAGAGQPGEEKAAGRPQSSCQCYKKAGDKLFSRACCDRRRGDGSKLKKGRFTLDVRKELFTTRVVRHWDGLPREVGDAPSLEAFKARLDGALSNLVWLKMFLLTAGGLPLEGPFQPKASCDSMISTASVEMRKIKHSSSKTFNRTMIGIFKALKHEILA